MDALDHKSGPHSDVRENRIFQAMICKHWVVMCSIIGCMSLFNKIKTVFPDTCDGSNLRVIKAMFGGLKLHYTLTPKQLSIQTVHNNEGALILAQVFGKETTSLIPQVDIVKKAATENLSSLVFTSSKTMIAHVQRRSLCSHCHMYYRHC